MNRGTQWIVLPALALLGGGLLAAGCGLNLSPAKDDGAGDAPIQEGLNDPWIVLNAPDGYANVAVRCYKGNGVYVTRQGGPETGQRQVEVIPGDPICAQNAK
jgi:hypothetical protein